MAAVSPQPFRGPAHMNVITLASRKGGAGKSTLTAQLAAQAHAAGKRVLVIDADPQASLTLWHSRRTDSGLRLKTPERGLDRALAFAMIEGTDYVFIDTAPTTWVVVQEAIRVATMVLIPARPGFFDLAAVAVTEIALLWSAVERSISAINAAQFAPGEPANADQSITGRQVA